MKTFLLPDLGEGLPDAEIVEWLVAEGDEVKLDQPMVSMETAKAVVEVPSPYTGRIAKLYGEAGDVIDTGAPLVDFDVEGEESTSEPEPAPEQKAALTDEAPGADDPVPEPEAEEARADSGTVVGQMESSDTVVAQTTSSVGGVKVTTAVRAIARKMRVDLTQITGTGPDNIITANDVKRAAAAGTAPLQRAAMPDRRAQRGQVAAPAAAAAPAAPKKAEAPEGYEGLRGTRRTMARTMASAHANIVPTTLMDDASLAAWPEGTDIMARCIRALCAGVAAEPALNAWFHGESTSRKLHDHIDVGMAVDTPDGLFVSALRDVGNKDAAAIRADINTLRDNVQNRSIPPEDLTGYTIMLSNFGVFAGKYASPVIAPPCVAILATGKKRDQVVAVDGGVAVQPIMPLSLTFDHRAATGGEASRFLGAVIEDLEKAE